VLTDLADFTHYVTRLKLAPNAAAHAAISEAERVRGTAFAEALSLRELSRAWQMLTKGIQEVALVARPLAAAEMVLVRLCHAADLPAPDEAVRMLTEAGGDAPPAPSERIAAPAKAAPSAQRAPRGQAAPRLQANPAELPASAPEPTLQSFDDVIARARAERDRLLVFALERHVRPVRFEVGRIEIALTPDAERDLPQKLMAQLKAWTGERWMVTVTKAETGETVHEAREKNRASLFDEVSADPLVRQVLERFPGAEIVSVRERTAEPDDAAVDAIDSAGAAEAASDEDS
jgi:DNA polymerase-3 subunit gamma/tau